MFRHASNVMEADPSVCGKTHWTALFLDDAARMMEPAPGAVHYCYGAWQPPFEQMKKKVQCHEGLPTSEDLDRWFAPKGGGLLVLDDLIEEGCNEKRVLDLFTKHSHHRNITVFFLCQDLFPPGKFVKTISRNAHYFVTFKNPRNQVGLQTLALQAFPDAWSHVLSVFRACTQRPFGYLMLDLHPPSDDRYPLLSNVLPDEGITKVYEREEA